MVDRFSSEKRRLIMQSVRRERTQPEQTLSLLLDNEGVAYTQNVEGLPGKPDFVFERLGLVVFVHGCFWHGHERCRKGRSRPKSNRQYWKEKIERNKTRDQRIARRLRYLGYGVFVVWECQLNIKQIPTRLHVRLTRSIAN